MAFTASNIARCTTASVRSACGGANCVVARKATAFSFQSLITSAATEVVNALVVAIASRTALLSIASSMSGLTGDMLRQWNLVWCEARSSLVHKVEYRDWERRSIFSPCVMVSSVRSPKPQKLLQSDGRPWLLPRCSPEASTSATFVAACRSCRKRYYPSGLRSLSESESPSDAEPIQDALNGT